MMFHGKTCETTETWMFSSAGIQKTGERNSAVNIQSESKLERKTLFFTQIRVFIIGVRAQVHSTPHFVLGLKYKFIIFGQYKR